MMRLEDIQGRQLGRYQIIEVLGRGGMAAVYRAHDTVLRRGVALKVLYPHFGHDASLLERFQREAIMAARLDHPNIVPIYDVGEGDGFVYIAMKLLQGRSLADLLREEPQPPLAELMPIIEQVAAALDYAHARGIIHRDIKAGNILLEPPDRVLLADFGIAKSLDAPSMTSTGVLIGTPDYMAPEQIANQAVDGRADIYALGVLVFRCLTGRLPFEGSTEQVLLGHLHGTAPDPSMLVPSLPIAVDAVVQRALARQPAQRYATAGEFVRALRVALGIASPTPPPAQRRPFEGRAVVPTVASRQYTQPRATTNAPTQRGNAAPPHARSAAATPRPMAVAPAAPARSGMPLWAVAVLLLLVIIGGGVVLANRLRGQDTNGGAVVFDRTATPSLAVSPSLVPTTAAPVPATGVVVAPSTAITPTAEATNEPSQTHAPIRTDAPVERLTPTKAPTTKPAASPVPATLVVVATNTPKPTNAPQPTVEPTATPSPTSEPTAEPVPATLVVVAPTTEPTAVPVACVIEPVRGFGTLLQTNPNVFARIGCPRKAEVGSLVVEQPFQRGSMLWYQTGDIFYVLKAQSSNAIAGTWVSFTNEQVDAVKSKEPPPIDDPPNSSLYVPRSDPPSGFYFIWRYFPAVREAVGWALTPDEKQWQGGAYQEYQGGVMLFSPQGLGLGPTIYVLYNDGTFERYRDVSATAPN